ncbi:hypothetical protein SAMN05216379_10566 [Nitrosomonas eutropha]|nr:hypothetical protein SAMN05216379_10566 [Nitrosomonas eutropha]
MIADKHQHPIRGGISPITFKDAIAMNRKLVNEEEMQAENQARKN